MVQILKSHVFFHLMTEDYLIASVQKVVSHGALQRLMREDITLMANGEIVLPALSVEQKVFQLNTYYLTDSYISFTLKLESWQIFCSNMSIRSSTYGKKNISDFPPCGKMVIFVTEIVIFLKTSK